MNELQVFKNEEFGEVRSLIIDNEPWFVGKDVATILAYNEPHKAITRHVDEDDRMKHPIIDELGRNQETWVINESGLYSLILSSKLPNAKKFKRWVTSEVLPTIRKTGSYSMVPKTYAEALRELANTVEEKEKLALENKMKDQKINELQPKADYYDLILKNKGLVTVTQIAKDYGMSAYRMNSILHELGVQYKQTNQWFLYSKYQDKGYTHSETFNITRSDGRSDIKMNTKWTQKGRLFLYDLLKKQDIIPVIEM